MIPPPKRVPPQFVTSLREPVSPTQLRDRVVGIVSVTVLRPRWSSPNRRASAGLVPQD